MALWGPVLLTGCGEENAAKIAPWLGMQTINESKADTLAKASLRKAKRCVEKPYDADRTPKCLDEAQERAETAEQLYTRDCGYGNRSACRKHRELVDAWYVLAEE